MKCSCVSVNLIDIPTPNSLLFHCNIQTYVTFSRIFNKSARFENQLMYIIRLKQKMYIKTLKHVDLGSSLILMYNMCTITPNSKKS